MSFRVNPITRQGESDLKTEVIHRLPAECIGA